jgi:hypothetical protein
LYIFFQVLHDCFGSEEDEPKFEVSAPPPATAATEEEDDVPFGHDAEVEPAEVEPAEVVPADEVEVGSEREITALFFIIVSHPLPHAV